MKLSNRNLLLGTLAGTMLLVFACKKDEVTPPNSTPDPQKETYSSLSAFLKSKAPQGENFTVMAQTGGTFTTAKGSIITIPPNAFKDGNGNLVTGSVDIRFKEVFTKAEMIYSGILPVSFGNVLESGGEYYLNATQNGTPLMVADNAMLGVQIDAQAVDPGMLLFFGDPKEEVDTNNWVPIDTAGTNSGFTFNTVDDTYTIALDSMGWGNIDAFQSNVQYFNITFNLTGLAGLNNGNTKAFAVFKNQNTVWPTGSYNGISNSVITEGHLADVPMNVVVISVVDSQLYYGLLDVTPQQGVDYDIAMQATTGANLDQIIANLP